MAADLAKMTDSILYTLTINPHPKSYEFLGLHQTSFVGKDGPELLDPPCLIFLVPRPQDWLASRVL